MKNNWTRFVPGMAFALSLALSPALAAAPATPQGIITGKAFLDIPGTAVTALTEHPNFPDNPDAVHFLPYFEWNATGDIVTPPGEYGNNYGGQIVGYFHPPDTGLYYFYLAADDNAVLYLSTDADPANKKLIARETTWSNAREYFESGGNSDLTAKDSSQFIDTEWPELDATLGGAAITLEAGQTYYIEALFKEGGGGDFLSVAVLDPNFTINYEMPIPGEFLSTDRTLGPATITEHPESQTVPERGSVSFSVSADGTPPYTYQWQKNGEDILDATDISYTIQSASMDDDGALISVVVTGAEGAAATSEDAVLTVTPDTVQPTILSAKNTPSLSEVIVTFSEAVQEASATTLDNYQLSSDAGALNITAATLSDSGTQITLTTDPQTVGTKYTLVANDVTDTAATPNPIPADSRAVFVTTGELMEIDGFIVFEAENYDRNLDGLWVRDTSRGNPSGGASMVLPNGAGGSETESKLEYDLEFAQAATYVVWYRASGPNGEDDSGWFHLNGERPAERADGNQASMSGFSGQADFVWRSDAQEGDDPFTVDIPSPGSHVIGLARREDGSFFDKFILTTDTTFTPTGVGPAETREGAPGLPTVSLTSPTAGQSFSAGENIALSVDAAGQSGLDIVRVEYSANNAFIGESTSGPFDFSWNNVPAGIHSIRATAYDEIGQTAVSESAVISVSGGQQGASIAFVSFHPADDEPNQAAADRGFTEASDKAYTDMLTAAGHNVTRYGTTGTPDVELLNAFDLVIISRAVGSGDYQNPETQTPVWNGITAPVMILGGYVLRDNRLGFLTGNNIQDTQGPIRLQINDPEHPIFDGISVDESGLMVNEYAGIITLDFVEPVEQQLQRGISVVNDPAAGNGTVLATVGTAEDTATFGGLIIGEWEEGDVINVDDAAGTSDVLGGPRLVFLTGSREADGLTGGPAAGVLDLTEDGIRMFLNAVVYMSGVEPQPPGSSIAFVSFHDAEDDTPTDAAAARGFTEAPDVGYTDLLRSRGHSVTRIVTTDSPDSALLNAFDLVIISRSVPSGHYQDPPETAAWNDITSPTMILGGYIIRDNRLGFATANNIVDTVGPVTLAVAQPSHPIFSGVVLDGSGVMANPFADDVTLDFIEPVEQQLQRGISVVTDPMRGGTVLATVAGEGSGAGGMIIGEWEAGAAISSRDDILGGPRMVFLTGSREADGLTSEGAGVLDLTSEGTTLFVNAVEYLLDLEGQPPGPTISVVRTAEGISIDFTGTLWGADTVNGPWSEVSSSSPHETATDQPMRFYRAQE